MVSVDFEAALAARRAGRLPCSSGEDQILTLAASIAAGVPAALGGLMCGLDEGSAIRVAIAVLHAAGTGGVQRPGHPREPAMTGSAEHGVHPAGTGRETVRVVRPGHPLHGLDLPAWGRLRLRGVAMVVLVLPDGSKKRIPAAWAGEGGRGNPATPAVAVVAGTADLLRLLRVISGVPATAGNRAEQAARQSPGKEDDRAACTAQSAAGPGSGATIGAGQPATRARRASRGRDRNAADHPDGAARIAGRARDAGPGTAGSGRR
jgi:hypothetical protein